MDTSKDSIITVIAAGCISAMLIICLVGMIILAVVHDGTLAEQVLTSFQGTVLVLAPCLTALIGVVKVTGTVAAAKTAQAQAQAQAQAPQSFDASVSDPGGQGA